MGQELRTAETALAIIGAVLWAVLPIPQIIKSFRLKSTKGLSPLLMLLWAISALFVSAYAIVRDLSLALQIEPHLFGIFAAISWCQCLLYEQGLSLRHTIGAFVCFVGLYGFIEVTSIYTMLYSLEHNVAIPSMLYGYAASVLTIVGLIPQFMEIFRLKQVIGISMIFLWIGIMGGFFMFASLCCRPKLDYAAAAVYLATSFLNLLIWGLALVLNPRAKRLGIWVGDDVPANATATGANGAPAAVVVDTELGSGAIALDEGKHFEHNVVPTLSAGYNKPDMSTFELKHPHAPFATGSQSTKAGDYGYDYSPPATPLDTPAPGYDRSSYFSSATLAEDAADVGDYGKDGKKEGGIV